MPNSRLESLAKRTKKGVSGRWKLTTGIPGNITNNETVHDIFTILLILAAIVVILVL